MKFNFTDLELEGMHTANDLSLYYYSDAASCGCFTTEIFALRVAGKDNPEYDAVLDTNIGLISTQKWALNYLDEDNKIDFNKSQGTFVLKSERSYLNMNVLIEKTPQPENSHK